MNTIESIEKDGFTVEIWADECAETPRDMDNLGKMIFLHKRYTLGDAHSFTASSFEGWEEMEEHLRGELDCVLLSVYMFDHSGISLSTSPFSCPWDSGQVGFIGVSKDDVRKWFGKKRITKALREKVTKALQNEVQVYSSFVNGEVYGYTVTDKDGETVDSCGGYYGWDDVSQSANDALNVAVMSAHKEAQ